MIEVSVNGEPRRLGQPGLQELVAELAPSLRGIAVAVNGEVVPRSAWPRHLLADGDRIEVLSAAAGG